VHNITTNKTAALAEVAVAKAMRRTMLMGARARSGRSCDGFLRDRAPRQTQDPCRHRWRAAGAKHV
jgi:hypothetical protein